MITTGSPQFISQLKAHNFDSSDKIVIKLKASELTEEYFNIHGFTNPIAIADHTGLGLEVPETTEFKQIFKLLQNEVKQVEVIDCEKQIQYNVLFTHFRDYILSNRRRPILNMISLEVSHTSFGDLIEVPTVIRNMDLQRLYWAEPRRGYIPSEPSRFEKYCMISPVDSYTDFHIDFSGTSVWYHMMKGIKIFYLIQPTEHNFELYWSWLASPARLTTFFADEVDMCYKFVLRPRETFILPTGWIHAVLTLEDSLTYGGNFLHMYNMSMQLDIVEIEEEFDMDNLYVFPQFKDLLWFSARGLKNELVYFNSRRDIVPPTHLIQGLNRLLISLKKWEPSCSKIQRKFIKPSLLIKQLVKELNTAKNKPVMTTILWRRQSNRIKRKIELQKSICLQADLQSKVLQTIESSSDTNIVPPIEEVIPIASTSKETPIQSGMSEMTFLNSGKDEEMEPSAIKTPTCEEKVNQNTMVCNNNQYKMVVEDCVSPLQNDSKKGIQKNSKSLRRSTKKRKMSPHSDCSSSLSTSSDESCQSIHSSPGVLKLAQEIGDINFQISRNRFTNNQPNEDHFKVDP